MKKEYAEARDAVFMELYELAIEDKNIILLTADTGAFAFRKFEENIPEQFFNVGIAEQNALSVSAGLALTGKRVFLFGISNFVTLRCFDQIKIDICCMVLPVTIIGMGTGYVYSKDGPTHHMTDVVALMRTLPGITLWSPSDFSMIAAITRMASKANGPVYIHMDKGPFPPIYKNNDFSTGLTELKKGTDITIIATGIMVPQALKVAKELGKQRIQVGIIDLYRLKPVNESLLIDMIKHYKKIVTLEEHTILGGLGSIVCEIIAENGIGIQVKRLGIPDTYRCEIGDREYLRSLDGISVDKVCKTIIDMIGS